MQWSPSKKGDGKTVFGTEEIESYVRDPFLCFYFPQQYCPCIRPNRLTEAKFFDPSSTNIYCGLRLGPRPDQQTLGQENRATTIYYNNLYKLKTYIIYINYYDIYNL